jgi:hypothetical protein
VALAAAGCGGGDASTAPRTPARPAATTSAAAAGLPSPRDSATTCRLEPQVCDWTGPGAVPAALRRPLRAPRPHAGGHCSASRGRAYRTAAFSGVALGRGPVRPLVTAGTPRLVRAGIVLFERGPGGWWGAKTLWFSSPRYTGPVLLRGRRLDGPGPLAFGEQPTALAREVPPGHDHTVNVHDGVRDWPGSTWIRHAGCYVWQADGAGFSSTITFAARLAD